MAELELEPWLHSLQHNCTGHDCDFCEMRKSNTIELGWEQLMGCESDIDVEKTDLTTNFALCTQQMTDFVQTLDEFGDFPAIDADVEKLLADAVSSFVQPTVVASQAEASTVPSTSGRFYGSPKSEKAVNTAIASAVPVKTKQQTEWSVRVWEQWARSRNGRLLPGEQQFSFDFGTLSVAEMKFWLCRFVLEVRKANGEPYNPTTLCCGLLRHLRNICNQSDVNFMDSSDFH